MDGMGYCIWRLQAFANLKSSFDGCICGPHTFHVAIKVDILNISSFQSVEKRESIQIGRSCLNNIFEQHQFGHFLLPQKMGEFLKNLSPFPDLSPKNPWFPTRWAPNNSEIIRVPISPPISDDPKRHRFTVSFLVWVPEVWYMRCGHEKFNLSSTDPLNVVTNTKALALLENHGRVS